VSESVVAPYPWSSLPLVPRPAVRAARRIRRALEEVTTPRGISRALGELLASHVTITVRSLLPAAFPGTKRGIHLETADNRVGFVIEPEPELATVTLARVLGRPTAAVALTDPNAPLDPTLGGALAAIAVESARRAGMALSLRATTNTASRDDCLCLAVTVDVDERPFSAKIWLFSGAHPTSGDPGSDPDLARLGGLPITLQLIAAVSEGSRAEVEALRPGDVWLPGDGWLHRERATSIGDAVASAVLVRAALGSPTAERGVETGRSPGHEPTDHERETERTDERA
jgi:hypothetical protein